MIVAEAADFPVWAQRLKSQGSGLFIPVCEGPIAYDGLAAVERDCENLRSALKGHTVAGAFLSAASPGVIARFIANQYYPSHETYLMAIADAMKTEYDAIYRAGFLLQVDCPELTGNRDIPGVPPGTDVLALHVDALNHALRDIPPEAMRLHLCWGNYEGPHHLDTPLNKILAGILRARPAAISVEASNPRHAHEWNVFEAIPLPTGRSVIPGVIDTTTNFIEHPEVVAQRLERYAAVVGRERVTAGTDCGFATFVSVMAVDPDIAWAKLGSMVEGARLASRRLWKS